MKTVSVTHEVSTIQEAVEGAAALLEMHRQGGLEGEDLTVKAVAVLALASCRLRDLGRACRGSLKVEQFWAPHNAALDATEAEDVILYPSIPPPGPRSKK